VCRTARPRPSPLRRLATLAGSATTVAGVPSARPAYDPFPLVRPGTSASFPTAHPPLSRSWWTDKLGPALSLSLEERLWIKRSRRGRSFWERFAPNVVSTSNSTADKRSWSARAIMGTLGLCPLGLRCTAPLVRSARRGAHKQSRARRCALAAQTRGLHAPRPDARETRGAGLGTPGRRRRAPGDVGVSQRSCLQSRNSQPSIGHSESVASGARVGGQADELAALFPEPLCEFGVPGLGAGSHYLLVFDVLAGESSGVVGEREPDQRAGAALRRA
jgi:hypothetical protein